ncbi:hypothetical protein [Streptomyces sp. SPB4]|uniref:hypothetical protein n=1 Tax=Streptomyces sp. SPB4 TaxID=2940553 RepID=UPI002474EF5B|nr:hypothetical protein [Streptomyces sp. SPB4]
MAWEVKLEEDRGEWLYEPLTGVGRLEFGMPLAEASSLLSGRPPLPARPGDWVVDTEDSFPELGVTLYGTEAGRLAAVAVDALRGPQVKAAGMPLVGQVPSVVEQWLGEYNDVHGFEHRYSPDGGVVSAELGVFVRVQRAGDILLTRPVFLAKEWTGDMWDCMHPSKWRNGQHWA